MGEMMNIQKEKVRKELVSLCLGELAAALSFWLCFFLLKNRLGNWKSAADFDEFRSMQIYNIS